MDTELGRGMGRACGGGGVGGVRKVKEACTPAREEILRSLAGEQERRVGSAGGRRPEFHPRGALEASAFQSRGRRGRCCSEGVVTGWVV